MCVVSPYFETQQRNLIDVFICDAAFLKITYLRVMLF